MSNMTTRQGTGEIRREGFSGSEIEKRGERQATAMATQARAMVESRYIMAMQRPRSIEDVRVRLLEECKRKEFAEAALYKKPVGGKKIEGLSIRFAEAAIRLMGNIWQPTRTSHEDEDSRTVTISAIDLETNTCYDLDVTVQKTVERREPREGAVIVGRRVNSGGDVVYLIEAGEDELATKTAAQVSKALRTLSLRLVPADILDECEALIRKTQAARVAEDPATERKKLADGFATLNVLPSHLALYLGHGIETASPAELLELREVFVSIREGHISWNDLVAAKDAKAEAVEGKDEKKKPATKGEAVLSKIKANTEAKLKAEAEKRAAAKAAASTPPPSTTTTAPSTTPPATPCTDGGRGSGC